jgi:hypothetical protein
MEGARDYILTHGICGIFKEADASSHSLWNAVDLPDQVTAESSKWGVKLDHIWIWKTELQTAYPDELFYAKLPHGQAVLMSTQYLRDRFYPSHHKPLTECSSLARLIYEIVRVEPSVPTGELRTLSTERAQCTKGRFATALTQLQVTLNIARCPTSTVKSDHWITFASLFPEI